jgi:hypothetical protein
MLYMQWKILYRHLFKCSNTFYTEILSVKYFLVKGFGPRSPPLPRMLAIAAAYPLAQIAGAPFESRVLPLPLRVVRRIPARTAYRTAHPDACGAACARCSDACAVGN